MLATCRGCRPAALPRAWGQAAGVSSWWEAVLTSSAQHCLADSPGLTECSDVISAEGSSPLELAVHLRDAPCMAALLSAAASTHVLPRDRLAQEATHLLIRLLEDPDPGQESSAVAVARALLQHGADAMQAPDKSRGSYWEWQATKRRIHEVLLQRVCEQLSQGSAEAWGWTAGQLGRALHLCPPHTRGHSRPGVPAASQIAGQAMLDSLVLAYAAALKREGGTASSVALPNMESALRLGGHTVAAAAAAAVPQATLQQWLSDTGNRSSEVGTCACAKCVLLMVASCRPARQPVGINLPPCLPGFLPFAQQADHVRPAPMPVPCSCSVTRTSASRCCGW